MFSMNYTISALDEYFMAHYSDYVRLAALPGYVMPERLVVGTDGTILKKDDSLMRLSHQPSAAALLAQLKEEQADTDYSFSFRFLRFGEKLRRPFDKYSFPRVLSRMLARRRLTAEEVGERLSIEPRFWKKIVKGALFPEKNTVIAIALVCGLDARDAENLFNACGYEFREDSVRDVVVRFLLEQKVFAAELRDLCLAEYKVTSLPIAR